MNNKQLYMLWHDQGFLGTWLGWFINSHRNFGQYNGTFNYTPIIQNSRTEQTFKDPLYFSQSIGTWNSTLSHKIPAGILDVKPSTLDEHLAWCDALAVNKTYTKLVTKVANHHTPEAALVYDFASRFKKHDVKVTKNICIHAGDFAEQISGRLKDLTHYDIFHKSHAHTRTEWIKRQDDRNEAVNFPYLSTLAPNHIVDLGRLMGGSKVEYRHLLEAIEEEPNANWKRKIDMGNEMFKRYSLEPDVA